MHDLREAFVNMQTSLEEYVNELQETTKTKERIESELNIASKMQMGRI